MKREDVLKIEVHDILRANKYGSNWHVKQKIDFVCEGKGCEIRHRAIVAAYRNHQFQTWSLDNDDDFWERAVMQKKWSKK